eukprot:4437000-Pleurochrysis_carterae.AAC.1
MQTSHTASDAACAPVEAEPCSYRSTRVMYEPAMHNLPASPVRQTPAAHRSSLLRRQSALVKLIMTDALIDFVNDFNYLKRVQCSFLTRYVMVKSQGSGCERMNTNRLPENKLICYSAMIAE